MELEKKWPESLKRFLSPETRKIISLILTIGYVISFAGLFVFLLWRCRYGFGNSDEAFYLTVPYRFLQGDRMLIHEWHLSQFASFTMVPAVWLYLLIAGTTEGIILSFRYIYTVVWCAGALFLYFRARRLSEYGAMCASLVMMCYAPFGMMALSYNTLGLLYLINSVLFLLCAQRYRKIQFILSGIFFAGAVLCCPYLAMVYLLYTLLVLAAGIRKKIPLIQTNQTDIRTCWKFFTLGAAILAILFLAVLFSGGTLQQILASLNYSLQDPEHANFSLVAKTQEYFHWIAASNRAFLPMLAVFLLMTVLSRFYPHPLWFAIVCGAVFFYLRRFLQDFAKIAYVSYPNFLMFPLTFVGIYIALVTRQSKIRWIAILWLVPGLLYTYCLNYSSNQEFLAISSASTVSSLCSLVMMWLYCEELKELRCRRVPLLSLLSYLAVIVLFCFQMRYEVPVRYQTVYWEAGLMKYEEQREITDKGPETGLITTVKNAEEYHRTYSAMQNIHQTKFLALSEMTWLYLINDNEIASYSAWLTLWDEETVIQHLKAYYQSCPEKKPDLIFIEKKYGNLLSLFDSPDYIITPLEGEHYFVRPADTRLSGSSRLNSQR